MSVQLTERKTFPFYINVPGWWLLFRGAIGMMNALPHYSNGFPVINELIWPVDNMLTVAATYKGTAETAERLWYVSLPLGLMMTRIVSL